LGLERRRGDFFVGALGDRLLGRRGDFRVGLVVKGGGLALGKEPVDLRVRRAAVVLAGAADEGGAEGDDGGDGQVTPWTDHRLLPVPPIPAAGRCVERAGGAAR